ncbi:MAG: undecaprenyl/decaprenyl-phosphate alpha-N-acetylglucosaminyl 1-phosphate transferase [Actinomycetota bacterium]|nr:undecaprenyl/decaprenyl-phosphate alpha-N-acetylglucosaminyl 1-phosphate transferase [Actinomycetota bacterium]
MVAYLIVFLIAAGTTFGLTPVVRRLAVRFKAIDQPSDRKMHVVPTPTMGGLAMWAGFIVAMGAAWFLPFFGQLRLTAAEPVAAIVTCTLMAGLGVIDDRRGTSALAKLTAQIFIAGILVLLGVQLTFFFLPGEELVVLGTDEAVPLTILWVVAAANAINLADGLDGLAAGMVTIAAATFFVYLVRGGDISESGSAAALLSVITVGICVGFLPWNFHPARIFMGDTGSMLLGMLVAIATISGVGRNPVPPTQGEVAVIALPLLVPLLVLGIPFLDVLLAIVRRTRKGLGIDHADKEHIFHRLMDIGHGHRQTVLLMYLWSALVCGSALAIGTIDGLLVAGAVVGCALVLFLMTALPRLLEHRRDGDVTGRHAAPREGKHAAPAKPKPTSSPADVTPVDQPRH